MASASCSVSTLDFASTSSRSFPSTTCRGERRAPGIAIVSVSGASFGTMRTSRGLRRRYLGCAAVMDEKAVRLHGCAPMLLAFHDAAEHHSW